MSDVLRDANRYRWIVANWAAAEALWHNTTDFGNAVDRARECELNAMLTTESATLTKAKEQAR